MTAATHLLQYCVAALFLLLSGVTFRRWLETRERVWWLAAVSVAMLGSIAMLARAAAITEYRYQIFEDVSIVMLLMSGYGLLLIRSEFVPLARPILRAALAGTLAAAGVGIAARLPTKPGAHLSTTDLVVMWLVVGVWFACCAEPIVRFWVEARHLRAVQRSRMRALALAYASIMALLALALSAGANNASRGIMLFYQVMSVALLAPLFAAFAPPRWLRWIWRQPEESQLRLAMEDLLHYMKDIHQVAELGLDWAIRLVGANGGCVLDESGAVLATRGDQNGGEGSWPRFSPASTIIVPLALSAGTGSLVVRSGVFTPLFGSDEVERVRNFGTALAIALDRVGLVSAVVEERSRYEDLLATVSDLGEGFLIVENLKVAYANDAYTKLSGYTLEELQALPSIVDLATPEARAFIADRIERRKMGEVVPDHYESEMIRKDGKRIDVEVAQKFVHSQGVPRTISIIRDISYRKHAEQELERLHTGRRTFIANAAHELRTPLAVVAGLSSVLSTRRDNLTPELLQEGFDALSRQVERVRMLIDNLLDLTQLEQAETAIQLQSVHLVDATHRALESAPPPEGKSFELKVSRAAHVLADPMKLDQVLVNMFTNAYRYGGSHVSVETSGNEESLVLTVADDGPGVPDDLIPHLFDPFTRGPESRRLHGSGLGLAIVRRLVEMFGGEVWYEPNQPQGARFSVRLKGAA